VDHKTTARGTKLRPGQPHIPTRRGGNSPRAPGWPRAPGCSDAHQQAPKPSWPAQIERRRLFQWDEEPATPIAGYHGTRRTPPGPRAPTWVRRAPNPAVCSPMFPVYEIYGTTTAYNHQSRSLVVRDVRLRVRYDVVTSRHVRLLGNLGGRAGARASVSTDGPRARAVRRRARATAGAADARTCAHLLRWHRLGASVTLGAHSSRPTPRRARRRGLLRASLGDGPPRVGPAACVGTGPGRRGVGPRIYRSNMGFKQAAHLRCLNTVSYRLFFCATPLRV